FPTSFFLLLDVGTGDGYCHLQKLARKGQEKAEKRGKGRETQLNVRPSRGARGGKERHWRGREGELSKKS
ncbi:MAG: hypothetical protein ACLTEG_11725, partial [Acutalibacter sp.]